MTTVPFFRAHVSRFVEESARAGAAAELYEGVKAIGPLATFDPADTWWNIPIRREWH